MSPEHVVAMLIEYKRREPFEPFVVKLDDGRVIRVDHPTLGINPPAASYMSPDLAVLEDFRCDQVLDIRPALQGTTA